MTNMLETLITISNIINLFVNGQTCLTSPPELSWKSTSGVFEGEITFDSQRFDSSTTGFPISFTSRVHNKGIPSPTLRFQRDAEYHLKLINNLSPDTPNDLHNEIHNLQYTNIHTHGLHISGESPADNIFDKINGGDDITYIYKFPCDHAGGTMWYHPHVHGSTAVQVGGGAVGAIIVDDDTNEGLPLWLTSMEELVLVIQHLDLRRVRQIGRSNIDNGVQDTVFQTDNNAANTDFWILNGQYEPDICLTTGKWKRFRIVNVDMTQSNEYTIDAANGDSSSCKVYLIAKDGVLIHGLNNEVPREITTRKMFFSGASRADVAVRCDTPGTYTITTSSDNGGGRAIANIVVSNNPLGAETDITLTPFHPKRPQYLHSLIDIDSQQWVSDGGEFNQETVSIDRLDVTVDPDRRFAINGQLFKDGDSNLFTSPLKVGSLQEWSIRRNNNHPFHIHVNHFQIIAGGITGTDPNWTQLGDWLDVLNAQGTIRFIPDRFAGKVIMHCHILEHEDRGTMAVTKIEGGCNALGLDQDSNLPSGQLCNNRKNCNNPFFDAPSPPPSTAPQCRSAGVGCTNDSDCCSGRCRGRGTCR